MQNFIIRITQENTKLLNREDLGCFILPTTLSNSFCKKFIQQAHLQNKLVLFSGENALDAYQEHGADGLIIDTSKLDNPKKYIKETQAAAKKALIGVICRNRRHEAMLVSECEPNFVIFRCWKDGFSQTQKLIAWYNELFLIQNAALLKDENMNLSELASDFIILDDLQYTIFVDK